MPNPIDNLLLYLQDEVKSLGKGEYELMVQAATDRDRIVDLELEVTELRSALHQGVILAVVVAGAAFALAFVSLFLLLG